MPNIRKIKRELSKSGVSMTLREYKSLKVSLRRIQGRKWFVRNKAIARAFRPVVLELRQERITEELQHRSILRRMGVLPIGRGTRSRCSRTR